MYPLPWNSVLLKLLMTVCCTDKDGGRFRTTAAVSYLELRAIDQDCELTHTSMLPHVWNAVNMNIKPKPRMMMFNNFFPSGLILKNILQEVTSKKVKL